MYVVADGSIFVYPVTVHGRAIHPGQQISGPNTGLSNPTGVAVDADHNIYVSNRANQGSGDQITVYAAGANGNVAPARTISGSNTGFDKLEGVAVGPHGEIYGVSLCCQPGGVVSVFAPGANGNVAPIQEITGSNTGMNYPSGVALDSSGEIYVFNYAYGGGGQSIEVFAAGASGNVTPVRVISGDTTELAGAGSIALDGAGNIYIPGFHEVNSQIGWGVYVYPAGANGDVAPIRILEGSSTELEWDYSVALDGANNLYAANYIDDDNGYITTYGADANGDVAPLRYARGKHPFLHGLLSIAVR